MAAINTAIDTKNAIIIIKVANAPSKIFKAVDPVTKRLDVLSTIGVERANEEYVAILAQH